MSKTLNTVPARVNTERYPWHRIPALREQLFDLKNDPHETKNLNGDAALASVCNDLRKRLAQEVDQIGDKIGADYIIRSY